MCFSGGLTSPDNYYPMKRHFHYYSWLGLINLFFPAGAVLAQTNPSPISITYPGTRAVFQRDNSNATTLYISGNYRQPTDSVQVRLVAQVANQGINTDWQTIQRNPQGGVFQGSIRGRGGWYNLQARAFSGNVVIGQDSVSRVGIGEVFLITGQSNAQGFFNTDPEHNGFDFGVVGATDDRVNCVTYNNLGNSLQDPPAPTFEKIVATSLIGPRGQSAWCWSILGDLLVKQYNVPVLFMNTAWAATTSQNWVESANGKSTANIYTGIPLPTGMPYANLAIALRYYCSLQGLRAILWQQGETDNYPLNTSFETYSNNLQYLINKTRSDTQKYPAWILARSSYTTGRISQTIIAAQEKVINTYNNNVYQGPLTDTIQIPRPEGEVHFAGDGLRRLAQAWFQSMNAVFFASSLPLLPQLQPTVTVACATSNNSLTFTLPDAYKSYQWTSGQTTRTLTVTQPGIYQAKLKDDHDNTYLSPTIDVTDPIQPEVPTLSLVQQPGQPAAALQQICADSVLSLTSNTAASNSLLWSIGTTNRSIAVNTSGNYSAQAINVYGCKSAASSVINLVVRPKLTTPTVVQVGTYSLQASVPETDLNEQFDWRRGNEFISQNNMEAKVVTNGVYSARAKAIFSLSNGNNLTCYSNFSAGLTFISNENNGGISIYPNPSRNGIITIETIENLQNATVQLYTLAGQLMYSSDIPSFNERKFVDLSGVAQGEYVVRLQANGFNVSRRIVIAY